MYLMIGLIAVAIAIVALVLASRRNRAETLEVGTQTVAAAKEASAGAPMGGGAVAALDLGYAASPNSTAAEVEKLWDLKQAGALTPEEFETQKARLLAAEPVLPRAGAIQLVLVSPGPNKINVIKRVRELTHSGLKAALDMVESAPVIIAQGLNPEQAAQLAAQFTGDGAVVELR